MSWTEIAGFSVVTENLHKDTQTVGAMSGCQPTCVIVEYKLRIYYFYFLKSVDPNTLEVT